MTNKALSPSTDGTGIKSILDLTDKTVYCFILRKNETGDLQYYYASRNNKQVFQEPFQIATAADLQQVRQAWENLDVLEWVRQRRPNSKWVVQQVTNVTFFITKLRGHPIGRGSDLPDYLSKNNGLLPLDRNHQTTGDTDDTEKKIPFQKSPRN